MPGAPTSAETPSLEGFGGIQCQTWLQSVPREACVSLTHSPMGWTFSVWGQREQLIKDVVVCFVEMVCSITSLSHWFVPSLCPPTQLSILPQLYPSFPNVPGLSFHTVVNPPLCQPPAWTAPLEIS